MRSVLRWGVDTNSEEEWRVVFLNALVMIFMIVGGLYGLLFFAVGATRLAFLVVPILCGFAGVLWMSRSGHFRIARFWHIALFDLVIFYYAASCGAGSNIHYLFFGATTLSLVLGEPRARAFLTFAAIMPLALWVILETTHFSLAFAPSLGLDALNMRRVSYSIPPTTFLLVLVSIMYLYGNTERLEHKLKRTLDQLANELVLARDIQSLLLPRTLTLPGWSLAAVVSQGETPGGDFYDLLRVPGLNDLYMLVGDVGGHSVAAGLTQLVIQTATRTTLDLAPSSPRLAEQVMRIGQAMSEPLSKLTHAGTVEIGLVRFGDERIEYIGMNTRPILYRAAKSSVEVMRRTTDDSLLPGGSDQFVEGDYLLFFTGGLLTDPIARNHVARRFSTACQRGDSPELVLRAVLEGERRDATIIVAKRASTDKVHTFSLSADWQSLGELRNELPRLLDGASAELCEATEIVASELAENVVKYGSRLSTQGAGGKLTGHATPPTLTVQVNATRIRVSARGYRVSEPDIADAKRIIEALTFRGSAGPSFLERLQRIATSDDGRSKLGLLRIAHQGNFVLDYDESPDHFTIIATRHIVSS